MAVVLAGCVHAIPRTPQEYCAAQGMVAEGFASSSGVATGYVPTQNGGAVVVGRLRGESVSCRRPQTPQEQCEVAIAMASGGPKIGNEDVRGRNLLIGAGYFFFLLPGIAMYFAFDSGIDGAERRSTEAGNASRAQCSP